MPETVVLWRGLEREYDLLAQSLVETGTLIPLKRPRSFLARSHPDDVARVEEETFIASHDERDAGPTNHWKEPQELRALLQLRFRGSMRGRTLYIVPYCMGPLTSPYARIGIELTDSPYVVLNLHLMTRTGDGALDLLGDSGTFVPGLHSVGVPLEPGQMDVAWPCNPKQRCIAHFPEEKEIFSFGSGYGGNALLSKKCFALRIASVLGREEGWLAEHMLILGITNPDGDKKYIAAAFPSGCGKTNLAMLSSILPGWTFECVGDDIAWIHLGKEGRLYAINPENGFFGIASGTSAKTNPNALRTLDHDCLFTNVALTRDQDVWWEGLTPTPPPGLISWLGTPYDPSLGSPAAHPNSRFTVRASQCPQYSSAANDPQGVPLSAILFGGKRAAVAPLVCESFSWAHGVLMGASLSSETTSAAKGIVGTLRHDPFAMLPFTGYHMGDYFHHWLSFAHTHSPHLLPKIYAVNWFQKNAEGTLLWPGFQENARVLRWIFERTSQQAAATPSPIGFLPTPQSLDLSGLPLAPGALQTLLSVDIKGWLQEVEELKRYFSLFQERFPPALTEELQHLQQRLQCT